jgi:2-dehydropantoate 2-reductase
MKILVIGTGVIGTTYAWQLSQTGCEITHLVRRGQKERLDREGIHIECMDMRKGKGQGNGEVVKALYRPAFIEEPNFSPEFELILVSVGSNRLAGVLELLRGKTGEADILFLQNIRPGEDSLIGKELESSRYLFGYPFMAGGGKKDNLIRSVIFGNPLNNTMLGEKDGRRTERLDRICRLFRKAGMNPKKTGKILPYLHSHYVWAASVLGTYMKVGSYERFVTDRTIMKESYIAMREAFGTCKARGIRPDRIMPTCLYYLPLFLLVPFSMRLYNTEAMKRMFEGHVSGSPEEMKQMVKDILEEGVRYNVEMPTFRAFGRYL